MTRIVVTGAGGSAAANFIRSLRLSGEDFELTGTDSDKYALRRAETDERWLVPAYDEPDYLDVINDVIERAGAELVYSQVDVEIGVISEARERISCRTFLPSKESVRICQDKFASYEKWARAGLRVPRTVMIEDENVLRACLDELGPRIWIRDTVGAFGKSSLPTSSFEQAKAWLDFHGGWGRFSAAEALEPESVTWQSIWFEGELVVAQSRRRLYWEFANRAPSGITGITGTGVTITDPTFDDLAQRAISAIDDSPHGIWSVDMTMDREGRPNPTEINISRFFTTNLFFTKAGLNMPHIFVRLAVGRPLPALSNRINPLPVGLAWVRGMDFEPLLTTTDEIDEAEQELEARRERLRERR